VPSEDKNLFFEKRYRKTPFREKNGFLPHLKCLSSLNFAEGETD
jgi:hypothetical protein